MTRLVVTEPEDIPAWLYPGAFPEVPQRPEDQFTTPEVVDFATLWAAIDPAKGGCEACLSQSSHCSTGVPHSAPDYVARVHPDLVAALADLPDYERWRVSERWAQLRLGRRPNQAQQSAHKELLRELCRMCRRSRETGLPLVVL